MSSGHPVKTMAMMPHLMAAATTTPPSAAEVMDVPNMMIVHEEGEPIEVVAEVSDVGAVTTPEAVAEVVVEVNTTSTGRWMTIVMDTMGHMMARVATTVAEVQEEGVTPWTIDIQFVWSLQSCSFGRLVYGLASSIICNLMTFYYVQVQLAFKTCIL